MACGPDGRGGRRAPATARGWPGRRGSRDRGRLERRRRSPAAGRLGRRQQPWHNRDRDLEDERSGRPQHVEWVEIELYVGTGLLCLSVYILDFMPPVEF